MKLGSMLLESVSQGSYMHMESSSPIYESNYNQDS